MKVEDYFKDKVVWVTGASSGIGEATSYQLSMLGARLILSGRNKEALENVKSKCKTECAIMPFDLSDYKNSSVRVEQALQLFGDIDMLINNGGQGCRSTALETDISVDERNH